MAESVQSQLARQDEALKFIKAKVKDIEDEQRGTRRLVWTTLISVLLLLLGVGIDLLVVNR